MTIIALGGGAVGVFSDALKKKNPRRRPKRIKNISKKKKLITSFA